MATEPLPINFTAELATASDAERLELLQGYYLYMAALPSEGPGGYIRTGGGLRLCLREIGQITEPPEYEVASDASRQAYMDASLKHPPLIKRGAREAFIERRKSLQTGYVDSVLAGITAIIEAETSEDALRLRQMPTLTENVSFRDDQSVTLDDLTANHLYLLVDTALQEHSKRREAIDDYRNRSLAARVVGSRALRLALAGGVFAVALSPRVGLISSDNVFAEDVDLGLKILTAAIFSLDAPEAIRLKYLDVKHDSRTKELNDELASDTQKSDMALRIIYGSTRYGGPDGCVTHRSGTDDRAENLKRFAELEREFPHLNNDPGGKPYTAEQAMGYAARLVIERKDQLAAITAPNQSAQQQRELYLKLCSDILYEDLERMIKGLTVSRFRKGLMRTIAFVPALLAPSGAAAAGEASTLSQQAMAHLPKSGRSK